jgi:hypothetical protein
LAKHPSQRDQGYIDSGPIGQDGFLCKARIKGPIFLISFVAQVRFCCKSHTCECIAHHRRPGSSVLSALAFSACDILRWFGKRKYWDFHRPGQVRGIRPEWGRLTISQTLCISPSTWPAANGPASYLILARKFTRLVL